MNTVHKLYGAEGISHSHWRKIQTEGQKGEDARKESDDSIKNKNMPQSLKLFLTRLALASHTDYYSLLFLYMKVITLKSRK